MQTGLETNDRISDPSGGSNQTRVRAYNERLVLSLVRRHGNLAKSEIARRSGLSAQTVSVIMRSLEADGLLLRGAPIRGKVGQPSIPMALNPCGVYSFGLKIGRRSADLVLINFLGEPLKSLRITYDYPMPDVLLDFATTAILEASRSFSDEERQKIAGIGIGLPFQLWNWEEKVGAPKGTMDVWKGFDIAAALEKRCRFPVFQLNDATVACGAELTFGRGPEFADFIYFFIGTFIGGGVVLNHSVYSGRTGNAGAIGTMPLMSDHETSTQLLAETSLYSLEKLLLREGRDPTFLREVDADWSNLGEILEKWLDHVANYLAMAIISACAIIDFEAAIIDGSFPAEIRKRLIDKVSAAIGTIDLQGIVLPSIQEGTIGSGARALGAATLPLLNRYLLDQSVLFKELG
nr:ROK family transcriptional regulator [uncultured Cohaesibacter sp.]